MNTTTYSYKVYSDKMKSSPLINCVCVCVCVCGGGGGGGGGGASQSLNVIVMPRHMQLATHRHAQLRIIFNLQQEMPHISSC